MEASQSKVADELNVSQEGRILRLTVSMHKGIIETHKAWIEYKSKPKLPGLFQTFLNTFKTVIDDLTMTAHVLGLNLTAFRACRAALDKPSMPAQQPAYSRITLGLGGARAAAADMISDARELGSGPSADLSMYGAGLIGLMDALFAVVKALKLDYKPFAKARAELSSYFEGVSESLIESAPLYDTPAAEVPFESIRLAQRVAARFAEKQRA